MFQARRRAFARHPLCRVVEKKKGREERNGREVAEKRERERERERERKEEKEEEESDHILPRKQRGFFKNAKSFKVSPGNKEAQN